MKRKDGISVIVPIYNAGKYLEKCITSLLNQKMENYEILLIDDGSRDNSLEICQKYEKENKKIKVFHKENEGISLTRNFGLSKVSYTHISFVDADDFVTENFLEEIDQKRKEGFDVVTFDAYEIKDGWKEGNYRRSFIPTENNTKKDFLMQSTEPAFLCTRCFHYSLFEKIPFPNRDIWYEDSATVPLLLEEAKNIVHIEKPLYYYRQHSTSITKNNEDERNLGILHAWERLLKESRKEYHKEIEAAVYYSICGFLSFKSKFCDQFLDFYHKNKKTFQSNSYIKEKIKNEEWMDLSKKELVPKKIHYFWFGGEKPKEVLECIETWRQYTPDYEIIEWNENNCNVEQNDYVKEAYQAKKYAFVADYFRLKVLYEQGGIYLDTDMQLKARIDFLRLKELSFPMETNSICAGFISSLPKNKYIKEILESYKKDHFLLEDGSYNFTTIVKRITDVLEKYYHISYLCENVELDDIFLYSPDVFIIDVGNGKNIAEHHYKATWWDVTEGLGSFKYEVLKYYFETIYKEKIRKEEEERKRREEEEERRKQEEAYENSWKRKIYKNTVKGLKRILPDGVYKKVRKLYRKIKPQR